MIKTVAKNAKVQDLICPECGKVIEFTGDSDFDCGGSLYYGGECECTYFRIYEDDDGYDLWYDVNEEVDDTESKEVMMTDKQFEGRLEDEFFLQMTQMIKNIDNYVDIYLYQSFYNSTTECYQLATMGAYNLIYMPKRKELVVAFRLENDGTWGSGTYYCLERADELPPTIIVKAACVCFLKRVGLISST